MGLILGKLTRKKSTLQELESIDKEIRSLEESRKDTESTQRRIVGRFVLFSIIVYVVVAFVFYFFFFPASFYDRLYYILPLIIAPIIILVLKRVMAWYFNRKIGKTKTKLTKLQDQKKKLLETVMETETYKVAMQILEKYAPEQSKKTTMTTSVVPMTPSGGLRHRTPVPKEPETPASKTSLPQNLQQSSKSSVSTLPSTPVTKPYPAKTNVMPVQGQTMKPLSGYAMPPPPPTPNIMSTISRVPTVPTPKTILPGKRSVFDKMVDYLVGDGPTNRYALICQYCHSHNGMALREEAKYTSFRCCYCFAFNPALVKKLAAPKLEFSRSSLPKPRRVSTSDSDKSSSDSESELIESNNEKTRFPLSDLDNLEPDKTRTDPDKPSDFGKFSDLERKFSEIESTIAEIKLAEKESSRMELEIENMEMEIENIENNFDRSAAEKGAKTVSEEHRDVHEAVSHAFVGGEEETPAPTPKED